MLRGCNSLVVDILTQIRSRVLKRTTKRVEVSKRDASHRDDYPLDRSETDWWSWVEVA